MVAYMSVFAHSDSIFDDLATLLSELGDADIREGDARVVTADGSKALVYPIENDT